MQRLNIAFFHRIYKECFLIIDHNFKSSFLFFFFNDTATTEIYTLSLHDALPIFQGGKLWLAGTMSRRYPIHLVLRSEEHTSELQSLTNLVCRLLLEKKKLISCQASLQLCSSQLVSSLPWP